MQIARAIRALVTAALLMAGASACGSSSPVASPSATAAPSPAFTAMNTVQACKVLRADVVSNGGTPDVATLKRIVSHTTDGTIGTHAQEAIADVRKGDQTILGFDLALFSHDCRGTGVQIPVPGL